MTKEFNPGDSVVIYIYHNNYCTSRCGIISVDQLYNKDADTLIIDIETSETESETCRVYKPNVYHACPRCFGKGVKDLENGFDIECDKCDGKGYDE
jgi:hypothetical protein